MKRIVRLTESDLTRIVRRVISEQTQDTYPSELAKYFQTISSHRNSDISPKAVYFKDLNGVEGYFYCYTVGDPNNAVEQEKIRTGEYEKRKQYTIVDINDEIMSPLSSEAMNVLKMSCNRGEVAKGLKQQ